VRFRNDPLVMFEDEVPDLYRAIRQADGRRETGDGSGDALHASPP
jgi:hypothetical protein